MRSTWYALALVSWASTLACCLSPPAAEDLLDAGFRSPEQTFRTFQTALRADLPDLEYRCLAESYKAREGGVTQIVYRKFREDLFRENPWLKHAARAEIVESLENGTGWRIIARVDTLFVEHTFEVDFVREDYYASYDSVGLLEGGAERWSDLAREEGETLVVTTPMPQGTDLAEIAEVRVGREWKIDDIRMHQAEQEPTP